MSKLKVSVALDRDVVQVLDEYASVLGASRSRILNDMISEAIPSLKVIIDSIKALKAKPELALTDSFSQDTAKAINMILQRIE